MKESLSCLSAIELYEEYIKAVHPPLKAKRILNELRCAILHYWVEELGFTRTTCGRKMTLAEIESAKQLLQTLGVEVLLTARPILQIAFENQNASVATRNTYGNRFNQFLSWSEQQEWWSEPSSWKALVKQQCCPVMKNPYGDISNTPLTERRSLNLKYTLKQKDTPAPLQKELDDFYRYLTEPEWPLRVIDPIEESSALKY